MLVAATAVIIDHRDLALIMGIVMTLSAMLMAVLVIVEGGSPPA